MCTASSLLLALLTAASLPWAGDAGSLGGTRFRTREAASARLYSALPASLPAVLLAGQSDDLEVRRRAGLILERWRADQWKQVEAGWEGRKWPWIDQLPPGHPRRVCLRKVYLARAQFAAAGAWGDYPRYREATRLWSLDRVFAGEAPGECLRLLDRMAQWEALTTGGSNVPDAAFKKAPMAMAYAR